MDIETSIEKFMGDRKPDRRYTSFDYCFNYFQTYREQGRTADLSTRQNMQLSCLQLGFYLASWGMFRASSRLPSRSLTQFEPLIEVIAGAPAQAREIDAHCYSPRNVALLTDLGQRIASIFPHPVTPTLITKIMLGVFGSVPALDQFVVKGMRKEGISVSFSAGDITSPVAREGQELAGLEVIMERRNEHRRRLIRLVLIPARAFPALHRHRAVPGGSRPPDKAGEGAVGNCADSRDIAAQQDYREFANR
jgi:hypothetical protein